MRTLVAGALAAAAVGSFVPPAHAVSSCLNNPDLLVTAAAGDSASCVIGGSLPALAYVVVVPFGKVDVDVACTSGFTAHEANVIYVTANAVPLSSGTCTLTITAGISGTVAVGTMA